MGPKDTKVQVSVGFIDEKVISQQEKNQSLKKRSGQEEK